MQVKVLRASLRTPVASYLSMLYFFIYSLPDAWQIGFNQTKGRLYVVLVPVLRKPSPEIGEVSVLPPQVEFSEFTLGPRFSGDPNGASKLDWSVFTQAMPEKQGEK